LAAELERIESHQRISAIDIQRFSLPAPTNENATMEEWQAALKNARAQLEYQRLRAANGALMQQYGSNAWRVYNYRLEVVGKSLDKELEVMNERITDVNRARKNEQVSSHAHLHFVVHVPTSVFQMAIGKQLTGLEQKWTELISSVLQIEIANATLEAEIVGLGQRESELEQLLA
jgi:hypothetical protein